MKIIRPQAHNGFTLLEVILVLLLLGVLAAAVVPRAVNVGAGVHAEAERLRANLRFAQSLAVAGNAATWSVQIGSGSYQLLFNGNPAPTPLPDEAGSTRMLTPPVQIVGGTGTLVFDEYGAPASSVTITLSDGQRSASVAVTGFTGLIP